MAEIPGNGTALKIGKPLREGLCGIGGCGGIRTRVQKTYAFGTTCLVDSQSRLTPANRHADMKPVWLGFNVSPSDGGSARFCGIRFPLPQATDRMRREGCLQVFKLLQRLGRFLSCYSVSFVVCDYFFAAFKEFTATLHAPRVSCFLSNPRSHPSICTITYKRTNFILYQYYGKSSSFLKQAAHDGSACHAEKQPTLPFPARASSGARRRQR